MTMTARGQERLYQDLARALLEDLAAGRYPVGARLPAERELAQQHGVSRPTVREAIIALEVQGLVEVRIGSGAYVVRLPGKEDVPGFNISAIELTEARLLFEGEAAALAATQVTDGELVEIEALVAQIARENLDPAGSVQADRAFHLAIARATRNQAVYEAIEQLWRLRDTSPEAALLHQKARTANIKPVVDEHSAVLQGLKDHDPAAARMAMRAHLSAVLDSLLFATEEKAVDDARRAIQAKRDRTARATA
ncbi:MAG TPA: FadR family transcriptional regulator [Sphingobium sp.]|jgi:GntR family transcriptional repressor for pyruvate dehydrogenase complex|nr:GntR family transcriptional regulator [Sphingobium sp. TCM1]HAF43175.1 FadR family transcriptional regulator [Sphingobium sp.]